MSTQIRAVEPEKMPSVESQVEEAHYRREIELLLDRLRVAERKLGAHWEPQGGGASDQERAEALVRERPVRELTWFDLEAIRRGLGSDVRREAWEAVCDKAAADLASGSSAASAVIQGFDARPYDRAKFLAFRQSVIDEWQPRPGMEANLVDHLAQAQWAYEHWMNVHMGLALVPPLPASDIVAGSRAYGAQSLKLQDSAEAELHSFGMATRWQNQVLRITRALRDLRRLSPVIVQNAGQVNVAEKQVNVAASESGDRSVSSRDAALV